MKNKNQKTRLLAGLLMPVITAALLFIPAGTLSYWQGWLFLVVFVLLNIQMTVSLMKNDPELFERRARAGPSEEKRPVQRIIISCLMVCSLATPVVAGLDHRFGWSHVPSLLVIAGNVLIAVSYYVFHAVFRENSFASSTIEVAENQPVISSGPYAIVRHPMYAGAVIMFAGIPLALASLWSLLAVAPALPILIWRILDEEQFLKDSLPGYREYCLTVKYRLIPGLF